MRGPKDGPQPEPESKLTNNIILRKIKIAFDLKNEDMMAVLDRARFKISKHELTAFLEKWVTSTIGTVRIKSFATS